MSSRRDTLKLLAALAAGIVPRGLRAGGVAGLIDGGSGGDATRDRIGRIGLQLYTVRKLVETDMPGTLATVAALGYREVEFAGYFKHTPADVRRFLKDSGLTAPSTHLSFDDVNAGFDGTADSAHAIGVRYLTVASLDMGPLKTVDDWKRMAESFNAAGRRAKAAGLRFAYHNHSVEFVKVDGHTPHELLIQGTDPALVTFELDIYWAVKAGQDPVEYFRKHAGRFEMVHVKDATAAPALAMADVGSGALDWKRIFGAHATAGIKHYFVEHDNPAEPLVSIRRSAAYLKTLRF